MKRIYISGPMTGMPGLNFMAFNGEAKRLRALGYEVVNPAEINPDCDKTWHACMRADIRAMMTCDTLALLPGWQNSQGAQLELHLAHRVGIEIVEAHQVVQPLVPMAPRPAVPVAQAAPVADMDGAWQLPGVST